MKKKNRMGANEEADQAREIEPIIDGQTKMGPEDIEERTHERDDEQPLRLDEQEGQNGSDMHILGVWSHTSVISILFESVLC